MAQAAKQDDKSGASPDNDLPIAKYDHLTVNQITSRLEGMNSGDLKKLRDYEKHNRARKTLLEQYDRFLQGA